MKKGSTAAATSKRNFDQELTIGLDLGDRSSWYCVLDEAGEVISEHKLGTTPKAMKQVFAAMPRRRTALETGTHSPWVSRLLSELNHEVIVAHARNVRLIGESRRKMIASTPLLWRDWRESIRLFTSASWRLMKVDISRTTVAGSLQRTLR